jgi:hypothetical protein
MTLFLSLAKMRDIVVIVYGVMGILAFFIAILVGLLLFFSIRGLVRTLKELIEESVKPTLDSVRDTAKSIQGTTEFVGTQAVRPVIRAYGIVAGIRSGAGVLSGLTGRKKR